MQCRVIVLPLRRLRDLFRLVSVKYALDSPGQCPMMKIAGENPCWSSQVALGVRGDTNAELAAKAVRIALERAGARVSDLSYLVAHTATPGQLVPPNVARVAELLGYAGPYVEIRQACTGFANALVFAHGVLASSESQLVAVGGSETGSVYLDPTGDAR